MLRLRRRNRVPRLQIGIIHTLLGVLVVPDDIRRQARQPSSVLVSSLGDGIFIPGEEQLYYLIVIQ